MISLYAPSFAPAAQQSFTINADEHELAKSSTSLSNIEISLKADVPANGSKAFNEALDLITLPLPISTEPPSSNDHDVYGCLIILCYHALSFALNLPSTVSAELKERLSRLMASLQSLPSTDARKVVSGPLCIARAARAAGITERKKLDSTLSAIYTILVKRVQEKDLGDYADPINILQCKCYALECLLENEAYFEQSPGQNKHEIDTEARTDKALDLISFQLHRALVQFGKTSTIRHGVSENRLASLLQEPVLRVLKRAKAIVSPCERWAECKGAAAMLDFLRQLGSKGIEEELVNSVTELASVSIRIAKDAREKPEESVGEMTGEQVQKDALRLCSRLDLEISKIDKWIKGGESEKHLTGELRADYQRDV